MFELDSSDLNRSLQSTFGSGFFARNLSWVQVVTQLEIGERFERYQRIYNKDGIADLDFEKKFCINNLERSVEIEKITNSEALDSYEIEEDDHS